MAYICIQLCICFDKALLSLRACMVYWGHSLSHYTKSYLVIQLVVKAVVTRIYNAHLYFLKSTTTSLISPIPHCWRCQQKVLLDQQVGWGKWSRFPRCVLSALSWNANENPSTDKVRRAINWGKRPIPPSPMQCCFCLVPCNLSGQNTFRFPLVPSVLSLLLILLTQKYFTSIVAVANTLIKNSRPFNVCCFCLVSYNLSCYFYECLTSDYLSWYWIVTMLLHISCYFVPVCSLLNCLCVVLVWTIAEAPVLRFLTFCQATQQSPAIAYYNKLQNVRNVQSTMLHSGS